MNKIKRVDLQKEQIKEVFKHLNEAKDDNLKSHLAKYLCVLISGYIEKKISTIIITEIDKKIPKRINNYVTNDIRTLTNANFKKIKNLFNKFDSKWGTNFENELERYSFVEGTLRGSLDYIISQRHTIAHGISYQSNISPEQIKPYWEEAEIILVIIENLFENLLKNTN